MILLRFQCSKLQTSQTFAPHILRVCACVWMMWKWKLWLHFCNKLHSHADSTIFFWITMMDIISIIISNNFHSSVGFFFHFDTTFPWNWCTQWLTKFSAMLLLLPLLTNFNHFIQTFSIYIRCVLMIWWIENSYFDWSHVGEQNSNEWIIQNFEEKTLLFTMKLYDAREL